MRINITPLPKSGNFSENHIFNPYTELSEVKKGENGLNG